MHTSHTLYPDNIDEISLYRPSRQAVDELFEHMTAVYERNLAAKATTRILILTPPEPLPVIALTAHLGQWRQRYGTQMARTAIIYEGAFVSMVDVLMRKFGGRQALMRIFTPRQRDLAMAWLRQA